MKKSKKSIKIKFIPCNMLPDYLFYISEILLLTGCFKKYMANILLAEDEKITAALFQRQLARMGHTVMAVAGSCEEVIALTDSLKPDVVLMDMNLKYRTGGIDACNSIKKTNKKIKVIFVSAYEEFMFEDELKCCPYDGFIDKYLFEYKIAEILK